MWTRIFQEYVSDHVALVVHAYLLSGDVLATWAVAAGIIWENVFDLRRIAHRLVIWGVVAETLCSLTLFAFDEGINSTQQSTIVELTTRLAPRRLTEMQQDAISEKLKRFPPLKFAIDVFPAPEPTTLTENIGTTLEKAGWTWVPFPVASGLLGGGLVYSLEGKPTAATNFSITGLQLQFPMAHVTDWSSQINTLHDELNKLPGIKATSAFDNEQEAKAFPDTVLIFVGAKP